MLTSVGSVQFSWPSAGLLLSFYVFIHVFIFATFGTDHSCPTTDFPEQRLTFSPPTFVLTQCLLSREGNKGFLSPSSVGSLPGGVLQERWGAPPSAGTAPVPSTARPLSPSGARSVPSPVLFPLLSCHLGLEVTRTEAEATQAVSGWQVGVAFEWDHGCHQRRGTGKARSKSNSVGRVLWWL